MVMQLPCFSLLLSAVLSTITGSYIDPEVVPSALTMTFDRRSPEAEPDAGFEDSKKKILGPLNNGFPVSDHNALRQLSAEPKAEAEATAHSSKIYDEFSRHNIQARRSAETEPIDKNLLKFNNVFFPGQRLQDTFNFKERRAAETEPRAFSKGTNSLLAKSLSLWISLWVKQ